MQLMNDPSLGALSDVSYPCVYPSDADKYLGRCRVIPLIPLMRSRLHRACARRQAGLIVQVLRRRLRKRREALLEEREDALLEEREDDKKVDSVARAMRRVTGVEIDVGGTSVTVAVDRELPDDIEPDEDDAETMLVDALSVALASEARGEACLGGRTAAIVVVKAIVDELDAAAK